MAKKNKDENKFGDSVFKEDSKEDSMPLQVSEPLPEFASKAASKAAPKAAPKTASKANKRADTLLNFSGWFAHTGRPERHKHGMSVWLKKRGGTAGRRTRAAWDALLASY